MTRRRIATALLLTAVVGGAGGYGAGELTMPDRSGASGSGSPIAEESAPASAKAPVPDGTKPLLADDLSYQTKKFDAEDAVRSRVSVRVPRGWGFTQPEDDEGRYTDPVGKRWIRVEAGFEPNLSPSAEMHQREDELKQIDPTVGLRILGARSASARHVDGTLLTYSTLSYSYIADRVLRRVLVRWISFGADENASVEMSVYGLPQDNDALLAVLQQATETVERSDSSR